MPYEISKEHVWVGALPDRPNALAEKMQTLSQAGLDLELILAHHDMPGRALLFISPLRSLEEILAAEDAGLAQDQSVRAVRITGPNTAGLAAKITSTLAASDLNLRAYSAAALSEAHVTHIAFESDEEADRAVEVLTAALK